MELWGGTRPRKEILMPVSSASDEGHKQGRSPSKGAFDRPRNQWLERYYAVRSAMHYFGRLAENKCMSRPQLRGHTYDGASCVGPAASLGSGVVCECWDMHSGENKSWQCMSHARWPDARARTTGGKGTRTRGWSHAYRGFRLQN